MRPELANLPQLLKPNDSEPGSWSMTGTISGRKIASGLNLWLDRATN
jgi:hypothetical protein